MLYVLATVATASNKAIKSGQDRRAQHGAFAYVLLHPDKYGPRLQ